MLNAASPTSSTSQQAKIQQYVNSKHFRATTDFAELKDVDAIIICVPTPLDERREPDLSYVEYTGDSIYPHLQKGQLVVLESTTYPGTTEELLLPILEKSGLNARSPPDLKPKMLRAIFSWRSRPNAKIPATSSMAWRRFRRSLAAPIRPAAAQRSLSTRPIVAKVMPVSSTRAAEMAKLLENIFRCVNIALVNELKMLSLRMGVDIWEVIDAAATKPFGFMPFYPGPGLGGHCIPVDPFYLSWKAREYDFATRFIELAGEVNTAMPYHVVEAIATALNDQQETHEGLEDC